MKGDTDKCDIFTVDQRRVKQHEPEYLYDAKNVKGLFAPSPDFKADISYYTTIFCQSHMS